MKHLSFMKSTLAAVIPTHTTNKCLWIKPMISCHHMHPWQFSSKFAINNCSLVLHYLKRHCLQLTSVFVMGERGRGEKGSEHSTACLPLPLPLNWLQSWVWLHTCKTHSCNLQWGFSHHFPVCQKIFLHFLKRGPTKNKSWVNEILLLFGLKLLCALSTLRELNLPKFALKSMDIWNFFLFELSSTLATKACRKKISVPMAWLHIYTSPLVRVTHLIPNSFPLHFLDGSNIMQCNPLLPFVCSSSLFRLSLNKKLN